MSTQDLEVANYQDDTKVFENANSSSKKKKILLIGLSLLAVAGTAVGVVLGTQTPNERGELLPTVADPNPLADRTPGYKPAPAKRITGDIDLYDYDNENNYLESNTGFHQVGCKGAGCRWPVVKKYSEFQNCGVSGSTIYKEVTGNNEALCPLDYIVTKVRVVKTGGWADKLKFGCQKLSKGCRYERVGNEVQTGYVGNKIGSSAYYCANGDQARGFISEGGSDTINHLKIRCAMLERP